MELGEMLQRRMARRADVILNKLKLLNKNKEKENEDVHSKITGRRPNQKCVQSEVQPVPEEENNTTVTFRMARRADVIFNKLKLLNKNKETEDDHNQIKGSRPNQKCVQSEVQPVPEEENITTTYDNFVKDIVKYPEGLNDCGSADVNNSSVSCKNNTNMANSVSNCAYQLKPPRPIQETPGSDWPSNIEHSKALPEISEDEELNIINDNHCINNLDLNISDISLNNLADDPLLFIVGENGELTQIETNFENNPMIPSELPDELGAFTQNNFNAVNVLESGPHENQFQIVDDIMINNNLENHEIIEENVGPEPVNIEVNLRSEIEVLSAEEPKDSVEVSKAKEEDFRQTHLNEVMNDATVSGQKRTRRKRHQVKENDWEYKRAKLLREKGEEYKGRRLVEGKSKFVVDKERKHLKPITCKCKSPTFTCSILSEDDRKQQFSKFWSMSWPEKRIFVSGLTEIDLTARARDRKLEHASRRKFSYKFHLRINNKKLRVCRQTFLNTFDLKGWTVNNWLKEKTETEDSIDSDKSIDDMNGMEDETLCKSGNKKKSSRPSRQEQLIVKHNSLKEFFLSLPTVESHYCRKSSTKLYLEPLWTSKSVLYEHYSKKWCKEKNIEPLSQCSFHKTFEDLNLALFKPKKDQCDLCRAYSLKHINEEVYKNHLKKKEDALAEKEKDKKEEDNVFTVDLQSLLLCPKSNASALYYRRKLAVHNLCIFNLKTKDGYCFLWNESEGKLTANEFSSILYDFIEKRILSSSSDNSKKFIFFSDGCTYQNRCATLSNALLHLAVKHKVTIEQKFLEKGHTFMECDSMHSVIERHLRNIEIHVPADYITICRNARKNPKPYEVTYLDHSFFKDFNKEIKYKSIRPGDKVGDPKVTDIRCLQYSAEGANIFYKLDFQNEYKELKPGEEQNLAQRKTTRRSNKSKDTEKDINIGNFNFPQLYKTRLKIAREKFQHLQELKITVPKDFHTYYDNLPTD